MQNFINLVFNFFKDIYINIYNFFVNDNNSNFFNTFIDKKIFDGTLIKMKRY